jgi:hypothetical protein
LYQARNRLHRHAGGICPLVGKTGRDAFCAGATGARPIVAQSASPVNGSPRPYRSNLNEVALEQLRQKLLRSLGI